LRACVHLSRTGGAVCGVIDRSQWMHYMRACMPLVNRVGACRALHFLCVCRGCVSRVLVCVMLAEL
jgi:hypothetical protein